MVFSYKIEFNDLQVLLGRMKDNWKFAHLKGASSLHVLDRFNIALQVGVCQLLRKIFIKLFIVVSFKK